MNHLQYPISIYRWQTKRSKLRECNRPCAALQTTNHHRILGQLQYEDNILKQKSLVSILIFRFLSINMKLHEQYMNIICVCINII